jgi:hypothetical protein
MWLKGCFAVLMLILLFSPAKNALAQDKGEKESLPDTTIIRQDTIELNDQGLISPNQKPGNATDTILITSERSERKIPRKAALYAAALPGLGQAYNGSYWKIPIVYGTFIGLGWVATFNNDRYQVFRRANIALNNRLPEQNPLRNAPNGNNVRVISQTVESARRDRDYIYILMAGAYALQIMEAITDAHLIEFDVNEDLSFELRPSAGQHFPNAPQAAFVPATGLSFFIKIK